MLQRLQKEVLTKHLLALREVAEECGIESLSIDTFSTPLETVLVKFYGMCFRTIK